MSRRAAVAGVIVVAIGVSLAGALVYLLVPRADDAVAGAGRYRGSEPPRGLVMPDFLLRNYDGRSVRTSGLRGGVTVLTFLDSQCTESCPVIAWTVARVVDTLTRMERNNVRAVAISTDPAEDSPASVRRFLNRNQALGRLLYLGGGQPEGELRRIWNQLKILSSLESGVDTLHSAPVRIYDARGAWVATLHAGADLTEANLAHDIRMALRS